jgi:outer membrane protein TolC
MEAEQGAFAATITVTAYLWDARGRAIELPPGATPVVAPLAPVDETPATVAALVARAARRHPDLQKIGGRVEQAAAQRRFSAQQVIPFAEAELSSLADREAGAPGSPLATSDDYKAGLTVRTPLLFMKERGRLTAASLRLEQQEVERERLRREVAYAVRVALNDLATVARVLDVQRATVAQARVLRDGEQRKFENGESTLFLVNARERLVLDEQLKLAALEAKALSARAELAVSLGDVGDVGDPLERR